GLGFAFEGTTQQSDWWLADVMLTGLEPYDLLHIFWHKDGILAFFPMGGGRWRVIGDLGPATSESHHADPTLAEVQELITHRSTAQPGDPWRVQAHAARQLLDRAQCRRQHGVEQRHPAHGHGRLAEPASPDLAQYCREVRNGVSASRPHRGRHLVGA